MTEEDEQGWKTKCLQLAKKGNKRELEEVGSFLKLYREEKVEEEDSKLEYPQR